MKILTVIRSKICPKLWRPTLDLTKERLAQLEKEMSPEQKRIIELCRHLTRRSTPSI